MRPAVMLLIRALVDSRRRPRGHLVRERMNWSLLVTAFTSHSRRDV